MAEWWIREDGSTEFADGDIGDMNHEGIVIQDVQREIISKCEQTFPELRKQRFDNGEYIDWDEFTAAVANAYGRRFAKSRPLFPKAWAKEQLKQGEHEGFLEAAFKRAGVKEAEWDCASGIGDARDYAMEHWGWKTYRDGHIDTWFFRPSDLQAIISGIENIAEESGWSDKKLNKTSFVINVFSNGKHFNLTLNQMKNPKKPSAQDVSQTTNNLISYGSNQANKQVRDIDLKNMHPAYKRPGVNPFGDSVIYSFRTFMETHGL
jgi:hypothetical protein